MVTFLDGILTVTVQTAVFLPSGVFTVIFVLPFPTALITPLAFTVATFLLPEQNTTFLFAAFAGVIFAVSVNFFPLFKVTFVLFKDMAVTAAFPESCESGAFSSGFFVSGVFSSGIFVSGVFSSGFFISGVFSSGFLSPGFSGSTFSLSFHFA